MMAAAGLLALVLVAMGTLLLVRGDGQRPPERVSTPRPPSGPFAAGATAAGPVPVPAPAAPVADGDRMAEAERLLRADEWEQAVVVLNKLRREQPENAAAPHLLATVYFSRRRWSEGLDAAQATIRKDPGYKADEALIKGAIRSLVSDRTYDRSQAFLRSLGGPATPYIQEAARTDESRKVRERAAEILGGGGGRNAFGRNASGSSSRSSSSRSIFSR